MSIISQSTKKETIIFDSLNILETTENINLEHPELEGLQDFHKEKVKNILQKKMYHWQNY
jgi:hypothetical protein